MLTNALKFLQRLRQSSGRVSETPLVSSQSLSPEASERSNQRSGRKRGARAVWRQSKGLEMSRALKRALTSGLFRQHDQHADSGHPLDTSSELTVTAAEEQQLSQPSPGPRTTRVVPTELCERIIDFVAVRWDVMTAPAGTRFWADGVRATLEACSLTCRAWRPRSQLHLMRDLSVRASITGYRSFGDMRALFDRIPLLQGNMEDLGVEGWGLAIPRFHLVPLEIYAALPSISRLALRGGLVYMPPGFPVAMRRFEHLTQLVLHWTVFLSVHDVRRMLQSLRGLKSLVLGYSEWLYANLDRAPCSRPWPPSRLRLEALTLEADAKWITDPRSIAFLDWLSSSCAISEIRELWLSDLMLIDDNITAAVSRLLCAAQKSPKLDTVSIIFGPEINWTPLHVPLASLPRLDHLHLSCLYDAASLSQLADCLTAILARPPDLMHYNLYLTFEKYPHHAEPPAKCWENLDSILQKCDGVKMVCVDRRLRQCDPSKPVIWGNSYFIQRGDEWLEVARERFPKVCKDNHLWAFHSRKVWHHLRVKLVDVVPWVVLDARCTREAQCTMTSIVIERHNTGSVGNSGRGGTSCSGNAH